MTARLDHLVVAAATLDEGARWCEAALGATPAGGGRHDTMGTHNRLLQLSSPAFERCYLEIIAIDPDAPPPAHPRWFGLDTVELARRLRAGPRLIHFVCRTDDVDGLRTSVQALGADPGAPRAASRGAYRWRITVREDGSLALDGALPTLIQWDGAHPCDALPPSGVALQALRVDGLAPALRAALALPGVDGDAAAPPAIAATLRGPRGSVILGSGGGA